MLYKHVQLPALSQCIQRVSLHNFCVLQILELEKEVAHLLRFLVQLYVLGGAGSNVILNSAGSTCQNVAGGASAVFAVADFAAASKFFSLTSLFANCYLLTD